MYKVIIHATTAPDGAEVLAVGERAVFYPPSRVYPDDRESFIAFGIEWARGMCTRPNFLCKFELEMGENHFDLVICDQSISWSRIALRPWKDGKPDKQGTLLRVLEDVGPQDWK